MPLCKGDRSGSAPFALTPWHHTQLLQQAEQCSLLLGLLEQLRLVPEDKGEECALSAPAAHWMRWRFSLHPPGSWAPVCCRSTGFANLCEHIAHTTPKLGLTRQLLYYLQDKICRAHCFSMNDGKASRMVILKKTKHITP